MRASLSKSYLGFIAIAAALVAIVGIATPARADWNPGDDYKMHFPQLPDPNGWDVLFSSPQPGVGKVLADDWLCTETGPVSDVHLWFSSHQDQPFQIFNVHLSIHADIPAGTGGLPYSRPGQELWSANISPTQFSVRIWGTGVQGWYDPNTGQFIRPDHNIIWQLNIPKIPNPYVQQVGTIYWLDVSVTTDTASQLGWKTSLQHFNDDAVWGDFPVPINWKELRDPITGQSLDLAFVITPEPTTWMLVVMGIGGFLMLGRSRKSR